MQNMNQPPGLLERPSPRQLVCPLVNLGRTSSPLDHSSDSVNHLFDYHHSKFSDTYEKGEQNRNRYFGNSHVPLENELTYGHSYYQSLHDYQEKSSDRISNQSDNVQLSGLIRSGPSKQFPKSNSIELSSLSYCTNYWEQDDDFETNEETKSRALEQTKETNYLLDNFSILGKSSPSLDQGYHTLVTPSPGPPTSNSPWNDENIYKGKKFQNKSNLFNQLSDDLIINIFSFLSSLELSVCARVCRRFEILAWTPCLWRAITLEGEHVNGDRAIRGVLRQLCGQGRTGACPSVEKVRVSDGAKLTDKGLILLARRCPEITHVEIHASAAITNNALYELATRCHNLQHLDVTGCISISYISVTAGPEPPRRLHIQYLDLTDCPALQDSGLRVIVRNCPQLAYLYLRRCVQITDGGLKFVPSFCSGLRELSVSDCCNITDFGLYELAKLGATLRYLSVAKCDQVSDAGLKVIAKRCYKLRYLNVRGCEAVSDDAITVLARSCTRLRALDIGKCDVSDAGLRALAECCPNLKKLGLRNCDLVTDRGVQCVAYYCRGLQQLNIQDCQISLEGYRAVKKYCKRCVIEHTNPGFF
ncbi:F-box/LRR-repeat protein 7 [Agrilus planipennis]|uniref:F-box/LRR-repeat protein 7 n=1 Tax=Agrilus planipennis TaxID=224129 RepID=A0A7F5RI28_AGRPL|nr:F-box/LRR-repeat protein 7 [Agrilus planipennis]